MTDRFHRTYKRFDRSRVTLVRRSLRLWLVQKKYCEDFVQEVILAVGEVATDAAKHGGDTKITVSAFLKHGKLVVHLQARSHAEHNSFLRQRIREIEGGSKHDFVGKMSGGGLRLVCALTSKVRISRRGVMTLTFLPSVTIPRRLLGYCVLD